MRLTQIYLISNNLANTQLSALQHTNFVSIKFFGNFKDFYQLLYQIDGDKKEARGKIKIHQYSSQNFSNSDSQSYHNLLMSLVCISLKHTFQDVKQQIRRCQQKDNHRP